MNIKGVGYNIFKNLKKLGINNILELFYYFPVRYIDRSSIKRIEDVKVGEYVTIVGRVKDVYVSKGRKRMGTVLLQDDTGVIIFYL